MFSSALKSFQSNIATNYTLSSQPISLAGAWKVFDGKNKKTGKVVSVFVFDRKSLEPSASGLRSRSNGASRRKIYDEVVERLKKEASSLARLRHPNILELAEPVEDTRNGGLIFATEQITGSLAGLLQSQDEQVGRGRTGRAHEECTGTGLEIDELEIQKGLLQVAKGLEFLHESAGLVHGNLTPDAIYVNAKSDWKISGLAFSGPPDGSTSTNPSTTPPIALSELLYYDPRLPKTVQLNLDYTSPDFVMDSNITTAADMFSFGLVISALYNIPHESPIHSGGNVSTYKKLFASPSTVPSATNNFLSSKPLPRELVSDALPRLITRRPAQRMNAREFQQSRFFDNILVSTIRFLDSLPAKTPNEKSQFMRGLPRVLDRFPKAVLDKKVLPTLLEEMKDKELIALVTVSVFKIIRILPSAQRVFTDKVLPRLKEVLSPPSGKGSSNDKDLSKEAGLVVLLDNMALVVENCSGKEFKDGILPIVYLAMESPTSALVDKSLSCIPTILAILDFSTIKNDLFPVVAAVFSKTNSLAIKVQGLKAFSILCGGASQNSDAVSNSATLDKYTVQEKIVPLLRAIKTKEPAVMMAALSVFKQVGKIADSDFLAMDLLPIVWSFSLGPLLNLQQFQEYIELIKGLSSKIEEEQSRKLSDLASHSTPTFDTSLPSDLMTSNASHDPFASSSVGEDEFERLVLGKPASPATNNFKSNHTKSSSSEFTWSSNPSSALQPILNPTSRTVTPDHALTAFAPLKPTSPVASPPWTGMQPLHAPGTSNPWASPPATSKAWATSPPANVNAWDSTRPSAPINSLWNFPGQPQNSRSNNVPSFSAPAINAWTASQNTQPSQASGMTEMRFSQPAVTPSIFNLPPPTTMGKPSAPKTGLDKYDSLI